MLCYQRCFVSSAQYSREQNEERFTPPPLAALTRRRMHSPLAGLDSCLNSIVHVFYGTGIHLQGPKSWPRWGDCYVGSCCPSRRAAPRPSGARVWCDFVALSARLGRTQGLLSSLRASCTYVTLRHTQSLGRLIHTPKRVGSCAFLHRFPASFFREEGREGGRSEGLFLALGMAASLYECAGSTASIKAASSACFTEL